MSVQYWAASASCFSVLIFLCFIMWHSLDNAHSLPHRSWDSKFSLGCIILSAALLTLFCTGIPTTLKLLWVLFHGFVAVRLVHHLLNTFPSCASIGETLLVTVGIVLYLVTCWLVLLQRLVLSKESVPVEYRVKRSEISTIIQGLLLGLLLFPVVFKSVLQIWAYFFIATTSGSEAYNERRRAFLFFASLCLIMVMIVPSWMQFVQDFQVRPWLWRSIMIQQLTEMDILHLIFRHIQVIIRGIMSRWLV